MGRSPNVEFSRRAAPPSGTVTFLFTDVERSTEAWDRDRAGMQAALRRHDDVLRQAIETDGGYVFKTVGDAFHAAFALAPRAVEAALAAQRALYGSPDGLRVRMALHTGNADERDSDYFGPALNRAARLLAIAHGGQVILSGVTAGLVESQLPPEAGLQDLGAHRLKDLARPEHVYQLTAPGFDGVFPPLTSLDSLPNNLPVQLTTFVGRDREVSEIAELLAKHRLVTLTGTGGVGKTRVSLQIGADLLESRADGVYFVEFAPVRDSAAVATTIAQAIDISIPSEGDAATSLVGMLRAKQQLLIFDNCEHLLEAIAAISSAILRGTQHVAILASSRQALAINGEATYRMPSLPLPDDGNDDARTAEGAMRYGAIALFVARAQAADTLFRFTDDAAPVIADICRRLGGIALAIELAAARVNMLKPRELRSRLDQRFRILTGGRRDTLPRQQTLRATIDWSFDLLNDAERTLLRRLAIFVGGFTLEGAAAVAGDEPIDEISVFEVLASLVDKSLVTAELDAETAHYRLLETTRAYACEKLDAAGERDAVERRHFAYISGLFRQAADAYEVSPRDADGPGLTDVLEDLRAALNWSERTDPASGVMLLADAMVFLKLELYNEGIERAGRFASMIDANDAGLQARLWAFITSCEAGRFAAKRSFEAAERALTYARSFGDPATLANALLKYGRAAGYVRRFSDARRALDEVAATGGLTPRQRLDLLKNQAVIFSFSHDLADALRAGEEVRLMQRAFGNKRGECVAALNLAENEHALGNTSRAIELAREGVELARASCDERTAAPIKQNLAGYLVATGNVSETRTVGRSVLQFYARSDASNPHVPVTLEHLALASALDDDYERAAKLEGYVEGALQLVGYEREYTEILSHDRLLTILRQRFDDARLAALFGTGAAFTPDEAIAEGMLA